MALFFQNIIKDNMHLLAVDYIPQTWKNIHCSCKRPEKGVFSINALLIW